jgi:hypothetical protein
MLRVRSFKSTRVLLNKPRSCFRSQSVPPMAPHDGDYIPWGHEPRVRESLANCAHSKEMVAVAMRRIDANQVLPAFLDPFGQLSILFYGDECIDQNAILPARDERRRYR